MMSVVSCLPEGIEGKNEALLAEIEDVLRSVPTNLWEETRQSLVVT
jgi:hypothetical protein